MSAEFNPVENLAIYLYGLFDRKKFLEGGYSSKDLEWIGRFEHSRMVRALIDPSVGFSLPEGYVPSKFELDLAYSLVTGRLSNEPVDIPTQMRVVIGALNCAKNVHGMLIAG